jgi:hypothetical protein
VVVNPTPVAPVVTTPINYCQFETPKILSATAATGNSLSWYATATGGIGSTIAPTPLTSLPGNTTYYVTQTNSNGCESPRAAITVTINPLPVAPVIAASPYTRLFPGLNTTIATANVPGITYTWFRNGLLIPGQLSNSINVNIDGLGRYTLTATNANGCTSTSNAINISDSVKSRLFVYPNPSRGLFQVRFYSDANNLSPRSLLVFDSKNALVFRSKYVIFGAYSPVSIDLGNESPGVYSIYLVDMDGNKLASGQVIIVK